MKGKKHQDKKQAILEAGMAVMWTRGYNGTSVKDIVEAAGIPKGSFYFYFESKEAFAREALGSYMQSGNEPISDILNDQTVSPLERIRLFYNKRIALVTEGLSYKKGCFAMNLAQELAETNEKICGDVCSSLNKSNTLITACLQQAIDIGELALQIDAAEMSEFLENSWRGTVFAARVNQDDRFFHSFQKILSSLLLTPA